MSMLFPNYMPDEAKVLCIVYQKEFTILNSLIEAAVKSDNPNFVEWVMAIEGSAIKTLENSRDYSSFFWSSHNTKRISKEYFISLSNSINAEELVSFLLLKIYNEIDYDKITPTIRPATPNECLNIWGYVKNFNFKFPPFTEDAIKMIEFLTTICPYLKQIHEINKKINRRKKRGTRSSKNIVP